MNISDQRELIIKQIKHNIEGLEYFTEFGSNIKRRFLIVNGGIYFNEVPLILMWLELKELQSLNELILDIKMSQALINNICQDLKVRDLKEE